jgi:hypothetical protein
MMNQQRMLVNQITLDGGAGSANGLPNPLDWGINTSPPSIAGQWPPYPNGTIPAPLTTRDVLRYATINGAKGLRLDSKVGTLTPGKEADIIILDATRINVAPLNQVPGAVVSLMDRTNVETVIVAGQVRKWKGQLLNTSNNSPVDVTSLRTQLEASRDYLFSQYINNPFGGPPFTHGIPKDLFRGN